METTGVVLSLVPYPALDTHIEVRHHVCVVEEPIVIGDVCALALRNLMIREPFLDHRAAPCGVNETDRHGLLRRGRDSLLVQPS